jgi:hypothetical protein
MVMAMKREMKALEHEGLKFDARANFGESPANVQGHYTLDNSPEFQGKVKPMFVNKPGEFTGVKPNFNVPSKDNEAKQINDNGPYTQSHEIKPNFRAPKMKFLKSSPIFKEHEELLKTETQQLTDLEKKEAKVVNREKAAEEEVQSLWDTLN